MGINAPNYYDENEDLQKIELQVTFPELWKPDPERAIPLPEEWEMGNHAHEWLNPTMAEIVKPLTWGKEDTSSNTGKVPNWENYFQNADIKSIPVSKKASEYFSQAEILNALSQIRDTALSGEKFTERQWFYDPDNREKGLMVVYDDYKGSPYVIHFSE